MTICNKTSWSWTPANSWATCSYHSPLLLYSNRLHSLLTHIIRCHKEVSTHGYLSSVAFTALPTSNYKADALTNRRWTHQQGQWDQRTYVITYETEPYKNPHQRNSSGITCKTIFSTVTGCVVLCADWMTINIHCSGGGIAVWFDYLLTTAGCGEMCQMALKQITGDGIGWRVADFSSPKIRINFKVDSLQTCLP